MHGLSRSARAFVIFMSKIISIWFLPKSILGSFADVSSPSSLHTDVLEDTV